MTAHIKASSGWKNVQSIYIKAVDGWKNVVSGFIKTVSGWKQFFSSGNTPEIQDEVLITLALQSNYTYLLIGTNYHWTNYETLVGYFEWSGDGGSSWSIIKTIDPLTNPSFGSSDSSSIHVVINDPLEISPNIDNLYRFRVFAVNGLQSFSSTSDFVIISTPRNVTNVSASQVGTDLQATISFTPGLYTNSVRIIRKKYNGLTLEAVTNFDRTTASPATIPLDTYGRTYKFQIIPYSGPLISNIVSGYSGNTTQETAGFVANFPPNPIQTSKPQLTNTGNRTIGTTLLATRGSYQLSTIAEGDPDIAIRTRVYGWQYPGPSLTSGTSTPPSPNVTSGLSQSLTTTQTMVNYVFYAVDIVTSSDAQTDYYFYSDLSSTAFMPSFSDDFNRAATTGSQGIGVTSTGSWVWANDMVGTYGWMMPVVDTNNVSWQIDYDEVSGRRTAYTAKNPTFANGVSDYPLKSINVGDSNVSLKVSVADGGGGPGLAFWVTSSGSWWAVAPSYYKTTVSTTTYPCTDGPYTHTSTTCPTVYPGSTTVGQVCSCTAGSTTTGTACNDGPYTHTSTTCPQTFPNSTTIGEVCSCTSGSTVTDCNGTTNHYNALTDAQISCGTCTITQNANYYQVCPTPTSTSPKYSDATLGTGCNQKCSCTGPFTENVTAYRCGTTETPTGTAPFIVASCNSTNVGSACSSRVVNDSGLTIYYVRYCESYTDTSTFYRCTTRQCSDSWSCTYRSVSTNASYYKVGSTTITTNATLYKVKKVDADVTTYYSRIRILSANGSSVVSQAENQVATSNSSYVQIYGLSVETSNNTITAKAYSDLNATNQLGTTLTHTASNPIKSISGDSSVGIINTPTDDNRFVGNRLDNFIYTNI